MPHAAEGFAGYSLFQNLIAGGQNKDGEDVTNDLSFMCIEASMHVHLPATLVFHPRMERNHRMNF